MSDQPASKKSGWIKKLGLGLGVLMALLLVVYFTATSAWGVKKLVLPRVGSAIGATVTVDDASVSPFSAVTLTGLKVQAAGTEPLFTAREIRLRYSLMDIIGGHLKVDEAVVTDPVVRAVQNADGTANYDPVLRALEKSQKERKHKKPKADQPAQINIKTAALRNAAVYFTRHLPNNSGRLGAELTGLNFSADNLKNGDLAKLALASALKFSSVSGTNTDEIIAHLKGAFETRLTAELRPGQLKGDGELAVASAVGGFKDANELLAKLTAEATATDLKQLALNFSRAGTSLGSLTATGRYDPAKLEAQVHYTVGGLGSDVLSLVGGRFGLGFGATRLGASGDLDVKNQGNNVAITGALTGQRFCLTRAGVTTPELEWQVNYDVALDRVTSNATIRTFSINTTQAGRRVAVASLSKPMQLNWGPGAGGVDESALTVSVQQLNLADWRAVLPSEVNLSAGTLTAQLNLLAQQAGRLLRFDLTTQLAGLSAQAGGNRIERAGVTLALGGLVTGLSQVGLSNLAVRITSAEQTVLTANGSGQLNRQTMDADLTASVEGSLASLAGLLNHPDVRLSGGALTFHGRLAQKNLTPGRTNDLRFDRGITGDLAVTDLTGTAMSNRFDRFETRVNLDVAETNSLVEIRQATGALRQAGQDGGRFDLTGRFDASQQKGQVTLKLTELNQVVLRSFTAAALGDKSLESGTINADLNLDYDARADSSMKGLMRVGNLVISDPQGRLPRTPITAAVNLDAGLSSKGVAEIRQCNGEIKQGELPGGRFEVAGRYDLTNQTGGLVLKLVDLNQNALRPFLGALLGELQLTSVSINANAEAKYAARGSSTVKAELGVTKLVITDPSGKTPPTPLAVELALDAVMNQQVLDLRQARLALAPTERAKNVATLDGRLDLTRLNAITGNLKLTAESLDLTPYYNLFADRPASPSAAAKPAAAPPTGPPQEPPAIMLPLENFNFTAAIGKMFLREVEVANLANTTKINKGRVDVNPFSLTLNGAPVSLQALLDLGVPGYEYDTSFSVNRVPLQPLVNSFVPTLRDRMQGSVLASAKIKGAGVTGTSLKRTLTGQANFAITNAAIPLPDPSVKMPKGLGGFLLTMTDIAKTLGPIFGMRLDDFLKPPITQVTAGLTAGSGEITVQQVAARTDAFRVNSAGTIAIADVLTDSRLNKLPVEVALARALAVTAKLAPANTPTNETYVVLQPNFLSVGGTLGKVKVEQDKAAIALLVGRSTLGGLGNLLGGGKSTPPTTKTNAPTGTNQPPKKKGGLLDLLK